MQRREAHNKGEVVLARHDGDPTEVVLEVLSAVEGHAAVKKKKRERGDSAWCCACAVHVVCVRVVHGRVL